MVQVSVAAAAICHARLSLSLSHVSLIVCVWVFPMARRALFFFRACAVSLRQSSIRADDLRVR